MKRRWFQSIAVLALIAVLNLSAHAADTFKFSGKVKVTVTAHDSIKSSVSRYLNRELRSLNDVELVDDNAEWILDVVAVEMKATGGQSIGYTISIIIIRPFDNRFLEWRSEPEHKDAVIRLTSGLSYYPDHSIKYCGTDHLQGMCKEIISDFDTKYLEAARRVYRKLNSLKR